MNFKDRFEFQEWLGSLLQDTIGDRVEDISGNSNNTTGRCEIEIRFKNGDEAVISISMENQNSNQK